ncbi:AGAP009805-PI [Anopheles gambiae str. PEST]|uniref:Gustatory receptor n=1 Tax=Anopheles gambiae TaxID=7165 RepID=Q7PK36_ANOGA|nr:AGAP009805-PI [Anopheles gambiae str. PEST]
MSNLLKRYRLLLAVASIGYLIPCSYNIRTGLFDCSYRNTLVCVCNVVFFGGFVWYDFGMILKFYATLPIVLVGILTVDVTVYNLLIFCIIINAVYNRDCFVQLLNSLFARDDWMLESVAMQGSSQQRRSTQSTGGLVCLIVLVLLYAMYNALFVNDHSMVLMDMIILLRFCFMFLILELYRVCVRIIRKRMKQLQVLLTQMEEINTTACVEHVVHVFLDRFQRYYLLIDSVNKCFSVPVTHTLLLIVLERTVAAYDVFENLRGESKMILWDFYRLLYRQVWEITYIVLMVLLAINCNATSLQVEETALCTRHFDDYRLQNTRAAKQIQNFLLKNLHQKKKFSACGFFDIDNTVIYMVFSSIVTYLVILIQFKQLETDLTQAGDGYNVTSNVSTVQP